MNGQTEAGRILAQKIGGGIVGLDSRRALVGAAAVRLSEALDHLRGAFLAEADDEGDFADALIIVQGRIRDAMAGCQATLLGMAEREKMAAPAKGHGPGTDYPPEV